VPAVAAAAMPRAKSLPLARRSRQRPRLKAGATGSAVIHALILAFLLIVRPPVPKGSEEPPSVEMVFGQNGSAGLAGVSVPMKEQGGQAVEVAPAPEPLPPPPPAAPPAPAPTPAPPATTAAPAPPSPPVETTPTPQPAEPAHPTRPAERAERAKPSRARPVRRASRSSNPFENLTDLSLAPTERLPNVERHGRGGSSRAVSLSVGPMVQGGHLSMPFSVRGGHGITADYQEMLDEWVNAHKYYPQAAADRGHDGEVALHVVWDRDGRVLRVSVVYGSGDDDLDDAWVGLFRGAHLPAPPPDVPGDPIEEDMIMNYELIR
jgi:protein TonB